MGFLEVKPKIFRTFWRNSGKIFRPFFGIFVARPTSFVKPRIRSFHDVFFSFFTKDGNEMYRAL